MGDGGQEVRHRAVSQAVAMLATAVVAFCFVVTDVAWPLVLRARAKRIASFPQLEHQLSLYTIVEPV